ncbi:MAG TPA: hypothetical protein VGA37_16475 [Gemmatimonadales bacterium]
MIGRRDLSAEYVVHAFAIVPVDMAEDGGMFVPSGEVEEPADRADDQVHVRGSGVRDELRAR